MCVTCSCGLAARAGRTLLSDAFDVGFDVGFDLGFDLGFDVGFDVGFTADSVQLRVATDAFVRPPSIPNSVLTSLPPRTQPTRGRAALQRRVER